MIAAFIVIGCVVLGVCVYGIIHCTLELRRLRRADPHVS